MSDPGRRVTDLEARRSVALRPRGGSCRGEADLYLLPGTPEAAVTALSRARELTPGGSPVVTLGGAERSFESHFLPPERARPRIVLSSRRLRGGVRVLGEHPTKAGERALRVSALGGTSFAELLHAVHATGAEFMPYSCPTADAISLGGALAVNAHSRSSATYGGTFADHVLGFRLLAPDGKLYDCRPDAASELERELYRMVPGSLGALGLVTELTLELNAVSPSTEIVIEVLTAHVRDPAAVIDSYLEQVRHNREHESEPWPEGVAIMFFGAPARGSAVVIGHRRATDTDAAERGRLLLLRDSDLLNRLVQTFSHRLPSLAQKVARRTLRAGTSFRSSYYRFLFFQASYDESVARAQGTGPLGEALGLDPSFGLVHQAWVLNPVCLKAFVLLATDLFEGNEFASLGPLVELFDIIPLPRPVRPLDANRALGDAHVCTLSIAARDAGTRAVAEAFCRELSARAFAQRWPLTVQLNKQHHVEPALLRRMHRHAIDALAAIKARVDPDDILGSRTLERLGL